VVVNHNIQSVPHDLSLEVDLRHSVKNFWSFAMPRGFKSPGKVVALGFFAGGRGDAAAAGRTHLSICPLPVTPITRFGRARFLSCPADRKREQAGGGDG
jgi:hypothetical protein